MQKTPFFGAPKRAFLSGIQSPTDMPPLPISFSPFILSIFYKFRDYRVLYHIPGPDILPKTALSLPVRDNLFFFPGRYRLPESFPFMISRFPW